MNVKHVMTKDPVACTVGTPVRECARLMRDNNVGCVVALEDGRVAGLVTDRQLTTLVLAEEAAPESLTVGDVMTRNPATLGLEDNIFSAVDTMRSAGVVRRLPVVDFENRLVGLVSVSDLAVVAKDLLDAILLEETHASIREARIMTGAKGLIKRIRRPTKWRRLQKQPRVHATTKGTPTGLPGKSGRPRRATRRTEPETAPAAFAQAHRPSFGRQIQTVRERTRRKR